jgi:hypothetical protein
MKVMTKPLGADFAEELAQLDQNWRRLNEAAQEAMLARDELVWRLMARNVSATAIANVLGVDRTWPYGIRDSYPRKAAEWRKRHPIEKS